MTKEIYLPCRVYEDHSVALLSDLGEFLCNDHQSAVDLISADARSSGHNAVYGVLKLVRLYEKQVHLIQSEV
jgi:hypothetical protein